MLIVSHAVAINRMLVTNVGAILPLVGGPETVNWAEDVGID